MKIIEKKLEKSFELGDIFKITYPINGFVDYRFVTEGECDGYRVVCLKTGTHQMDSTDLEDLHKRYTELGKIEVLTDKATLTIN